MWVFQRAGVDKGRGFSMSVTLNQDLDEMRRTMTSHSLEGTVSPCLLVSWAYIFIHLFDNYFLSAWHTHMLFLRLSGGFNLSHFSLILLRNYKDRDRVLFIFVAPLLPCALGDKAFSRETNGWIFWNSSTSKSQNSIFFLVASKVNIHLSRENQG